MSVEVSGGRTSAALAPQAATASTKISYFFSMVQPTTNVKQLSTYCGLGYRVDYQEDDTGTKSWTDLMTAAIPAIQADIDQWGLP